MTMKIADLWDMMSCSLQIGTSIQEDHDAIRHLPVYSVYSNVQCTVDMNLHNVYLQVLQNWFDFEIGGTLKLEDEEEEEEGEGKEEENDCSDSIVTGTNEKVKLIISGFEQPVDTALYKVIPKCQGIILK